MRGGLRQWALVQGRLVRPETQRGSQATMETLAAAWPSLSQFWERGSRQE